MKKILAMILTLCTVIGMLPVGIIAAEETDTATETASEEATALKWEYEPYGEGVALTKYLGDSTDVFVPAKIEADGTKYDVIKLGDGIFEDNDALNSVTLADGITEIGARAFYDADALVCIVTNEQLTTIGDEAFYSCDSFNSVILYDAVTSIGTEAFYGCPQLVVWCNENSAGHLYVQENSIAYQLLDAEATPETYTVGSVTYYILKGEAYIIGYDGSESSVVVPSYVKGYPVVGLREVFKNSTIVTDVTLPNTLRSISDNAFYGCSALTAVNIPDNVTSIGSYAFYKCTSLKEIFVPDGVVALGESTFYGCTSLTIADKGDGVESVGRWLFYGCTSLTTVGISDRLTEITEYMFYNCKKLTDVVIPYGVKTILGYAFEYCSSITSITIPDSVTYIAACAFEFCGLTSVTIPKSVTSIGKDAFRCSNLETLIINEGVPAPAYRFYCTAKNLTIPGSFKTISANVFEASAHSELESLAIGEGITTIDSGIFAKAVNLRKVLIPQSVTSMHIDSFSPNTLLVVYEDSYAHRFAEENNLYTVFMMKTALPNL